MCLVYNIRKQRNLNMLDSYSSSYVLGSISFVMSVRPPVRLSAQNNSAPTGRIFMKFDEFFF
jgi:hypothetical protein